MASRILTQDTVLSGWSVTMSPSLNSQLLRHLAYNGGRRSGSSAKSAPRAQPQAWKVVSFPAQSPGPPGMVHLPSSIISKAGRLTGPKSPCRAVTSPQALSWNSLLLSHATCCEHRGFPLCWCSAGSQCSTLPLELLLSWNLGMCSES